MFKKWGKWHYGENPPESEEDGVRYLAAIHDTIYDTPYVREMWYDGNGHWSAESREGVMGTVYAWATWPAPPPTPREEE